jgi:hypothetical protein
MILTPKDRFRESPEARQWKAAMESFWFQQGMTVALAHMVMNASPTGNDAVGAAAAFNRMEGAKALIHTMMNLAETPPPPSTPTNHNLKPV